MAPVRGRPRLFCDAACADLFDRRAVHLRHLAASLASTRRRLEALDAAALELLERESGVPRGTPATADLVEVALKSANLASGRNQIYLGVLAYLNPAASRYDRGGRPKLPKGNPDDH